MKPIINDLIDLIESIKNDLENSMHYAYELLKNPSCPVEVLEHFAECQPQELLHEMIASNPSCPKNLMQQIFYKTKKLEVLRALASNPNCHSELMIQLFHTGDDDVIYDLLRNQNCSEEFLQTVFDTSFDVEEALKHKNASLSMLKSGAETVYIGNHRGVATTLSNKITPEILEMIVDKGNVDFFVLKHPKCTVDLMHKILSRRKTTIESMISTLQQLEQKETT